MTKNRSLARLIWPMTNQDHLTQNRAHGAKSAETDDSASPHGPPNHSLQSAIPLVKFCLALANPETINLMSTRAVNIMLITAVEHRQRVREIALGSVLHKLTAKDHSLNQQLGIFNGLGNANYLARSGELAPPWRHPAKAWTIVR
jgi:hypothetical protein